MSGQVLGYVRTSTDRQGLSLQAQEERIRAMATVHGFTLTNMFIETESAASLDRPELARLLALVDARKVSTVIVAKLDRLTRSVRDLADLLERFEKRGVALMSVAEMLDTKSAAGRLVMNVMASVSQWERETIGERTREVLRHKRQRGERTSRFSPYGYRFGADGCTLEPCPSEQHTLWTIRSARDGGSTLQAIADVLNAQGLRTRAGSTWRYQHVQTALRAA
jgi:site-specific DNA recombinase